MPRKVYAPGSDDGETEEAPPVEEPPEDEPVTPPKDNSAQPDSDPSKGGFPWDDLMEWFGGGGGGAGIGGGNGGGNVGGRPFNFFPFNPNSGGGNSSVYDRYYENLPGYSDPGGYDWEALEKMFMPNGGGGGGGGGASAQRDFLNNLFGPGGESVGQLNPDFINSINALNQGNAADYGEFTNNILGLGQSVRDQIGGEDIIKMLMGGLQGGGGNFGGGAFRGGGGGGEFTPQLNSSTMEELFNSIPEFKARDIETKLQALDPETAAQLDKIRAAESAELEAARKDQNSEMLTRLFGKGQERSTVAGEALDRANESYERSLLNLQAEDVSRRLGIQQGDAERLLAAGLGQLNAEAGAYGDKVRSATSVKTSEIGANAQLQSASMAARASAAASSSAAHASMNNAKLAALADIFGSRSAALANTLGSQTGALASGFGSRTEGATSFADLYGNLALGGAELDLTKNLELAKIAQGGIDSARAAGLGRQQQQMSNFFNFLNFKENVLGRYQEGGLTQGGFDLERYLGELQAKTQMSLGKQNEASGWEKALAALGPILASYYANR